MLPIPKYPNTAAFVRRSEIIFKNFMYKDHTMILPMNEPIVDIEFVEEKIPDAELEAADKKKKDKEKKKAEKEKQKAEKEKEKEKEKGEKEKDK